MSTVAEVAADIYRSWLSSPEDQPVIVTLSGSLTDSATTLTYTDSTLAPDEEALLGPGVIIEFAPDGEQARITESDPTANTLTVVRGVNGTVKAAHADGSEITVAPSVSRVSVIEAIYDNVVALYPSLWHEATATITTAATYIEVPATVVTPVGFRYVNGDHYPEGNVQFERNFSPSSTGKAIFTASYIPDGVTGYFTYRSKFARPTAVSDELADLGVDAGWERIVQVGAAAQVIGQRPVDELTAEYLTEQLQREALPPGASTDIRNGLLTLRNLWLEQAARVLRADRRMPVTYNPIVRR